MKAIRMWTAALALLVAVSALAEWDMGDLPPCSYPTLFGNPAHSISGKAWLGQCITSETIPFGVNSDACDDGVTFIDLPWTPCSVEQLTVTVTAGPNFTGNPLWLNAWKDGNLDGDFCDTLCGGAADEWIVQNVPVTPGIHTFAVLDPGVFNLGVYDGVFRFRLTGRSLDRMGFGFYDPWNCADSPFCGNFGADSLGEVEDYWLEDQQLRVSLSRFDVTTGDRRVTLAWSTAGETGNDRFEILRNGAAVAAVEGAGNSASGHDYTWTDHGLVNGATYTYTLVAVDIAGNRDVLRAASATPRAGSGAAAEFTLLQNYPNPFNPATTIAFDLPEAGHAVLTVYDMTGRQIATPVNGSLPAGRHAVSFDGTGLPSGLYIYRLDAPGFSAQKKMLLMK